VSRLEAHPNIQILEAREPEYRDENSCSYGERSDTGDLCA
jgi:hypothetical protein